MNRVMLLSEDEVLKDYLESLLTEKGYRLDDGAKNLIIDLDTAETVGGERVITLSKDPYRLSDLTRPFRNRELLALCETRFGEASSSALPQERTVRAAGDEGAEMRLSENALWFQGEEIILTPGEYRLLKCLLERRGEVVSFSDCAEALGGLADKGNSPSVYVNHLRKKLDYRFGKRMIVTLRQKGYSLL